MKSRYFNWDDDEKIDLLKIEVTKLETELDSAHQRIAELEKEIAVDRQQYIFLEEDLIEKSKRIAEIERALKRIATIANREA